MVVSIHPAEASGTTQPPGFVYIMILGKVVGTIVTTISHPHYKNRRLLVVQPLVMDGDQPEPNEDFIALDNAQAGIGDTVLVNREGEPRGLILANGEQFNLGKEVENAGLSFDQNTNVSVEGEIVKGQFGTFVRPKVLSVGNQTFTFGR